MNPATLLIADDNERVREILERCLGDGRRTLVAGDGKTALELARQHLPDLLILDVCMPERNGREVCAELRSDARTRGIPILMLTGEGMEARELAGLENAPDDYLAKPFDLNELNARVMALLSRRR